MYQLWEVKKVKGKWQVTNLAEREGLDDLKTFALVELYIQPSEWGTNPIDSDLHYNVNTDPDHRRHYGIAWHD